MKRILLLAALATATAPATLAQRTPPPVMVEVDTQPAPLADHVVQAAYPETARRDTVDSRVFLKLWIRAHGAIETIELLRQTETRNGAELPAHNPYAPLFLAAATDAARQWRFTPAVKDANP